VDTKEESSLYIVIDEKYIGDANAFHDKPNNLKK